MKRRSSACLAAESIFSLPRMPLWPGTQMNVTGIKFAVKVVRREWKRVTRGWGEDGCAMAENAAKESKIIRY